MMHNISAYAVTLQQASGTPRLLRAGGLQR